MCRQATKLMVCLTLLSVLALSRQTPAQMQEPINTSFVGSDSLMTLVLRPQPLLKYVEKNRDINEQFVKMMLPETGIDPNNIKQFVFQAGVNGPLADPDDIENSFNMILHFDKPVDGKTIVERTLGEFETVKHDGLTYFKGNDHEPCIHFPDDRAAIFANEPRMRELIVAPMSMGRVVHQLREIDAKNEIVIIVSAENAGDQMRMFADGMSFLFPTIAEAQLHESLASATLVAQLSADVPITADITATSPEAARKIAKSIDGLIAMGKAWLPEGKKEILEEAPDPYGKLAVGFLEKLLAGTEVATDKDRVKLALKVKGGVPEAVELLVGSMMIGVGGAADEVAPAVEAVPLEVAPRERGE